MILPLITSRRFNSILFLRRVHNLILLYTTCLFLPGLSVKWAQTALLRTAGCRIVSREKERDECSCERSLPWIIALSVQLHLIRVPPQMRFECSIHIGVQFQINYVVAERWVGANAPRHENKHGKLVGNATHVRFIIEVSCAWHLCSVLFIQRFKLNYFSEETRTFLRQGHLMSSETWHWISLYVPEKISIWNIFCGLYV